MSATVLPAPASAPPHALPAEDVLTMLGSGPHGLTAADAAARLAEDGPNELVDRGATPGWRILLAQLRQVMVLILIGAALLSLVLGKLLEAGAIGAIVVLFAVLGFLQEHRAERAIAALRAMAVAVVKVTRDGRLVEVPASHLVRGDRVMLEAGTVVPADMRLVEVADLRIAEAALTGESEPVVKATAALPHRTDGADVPLGDRTCAAFRGTQVAAGRGVGVVTATGMDTEIGRIADLLQEVEGGATPLQARLDRVGVQLAVLGMAVAAVVAGLGLLAGETPADLALTAISVAVAVIPEGLPAVVTFTLAIGAQRMLRRQALIRSLPAVETLGSTTVICSDKTGTLTENRMTVVHLWTSEGQGTPADLADQPVAAAALAAGALCNDADAPSEPGAELVGDPTETALVAAAVATGIDVRELRRQAPRVAERPFDADRKRMSTVHAPLGTAGGALALLAPDVAIAMVKGAGEQVVARATAVQTQAGPSPLDASGRDALVARADAMAAEGLRVLGIAWRPLAGGAADLAHAEDDLVLLGLVGIIDPPRQEVAEAVATCRAAGIRPVMITGDHPLTARAIAAQLGIGDEHTPVVSGADLQAMTDDELDRVVATAGVYARVAPADKLRVVAALQQRGEVVAMTGDGVNDAPALKRADIGVAMGITGTDVSKEAADVVLRDDNFATIVATVEEGRTIYDNLRRFVSFAVAGNIGKILVMVGWPLALLLTGTVSAETAVALLPLQLLWLNLMTDGLLGLAMGFEPTEPDAMRRGPTPSSAGLWHGGLGRRTVWVGLLVGALALGVGLVALSAGDPAWQTMMFTTIAFAQVFQALGSRSATASVFATPLTTNRVLLGVVPAVVVLQLLALVTPLAGLLGLVPLSLVQLGVCVGLGAVVLLALEVAKATRVRGGG